MNAHVPLPRRQALGMLGGLGAIVAALPASAATPRAPSQRRKTITARDGTVLFHRDWGDGRPVVFLAGWGLPSESWAYQVAPLSDQGLRCVAYDRRGHGRSDDPGRGYDYDTLADDLAAVLETLDLEDVVLVGHSMAAGEIGRYLARHGDARIAKVLFLAPIGPCVTRRADNPDGLDPAMFEQFRQGVLLRDYPRWLEENSGPFLTPETSREMKDWIRGMMLTTSLKALVECNRALTGADMRGDVAAIRKPCLVIHGDRDASAPLDFTGRRFAGLAPGAKLSIYQGAPHGLQFTHIERLNAEILAFART